MKHMLFGKVDFDCIFHDILSWQIQYTWHDFNMKKTNEILSFYRYENILTFVSFLCSSPPPTPTSMQMIVHDGASNPRILMFFYGTLISIPNPASASPTK
jgi:hypothetical protein